MKKDLLAKLSLEEKCYFLCGEDHWHTRELKKINLSRLNMSDGPYGIRKVIKSDGFVGEESVKATAFPTTVVLGSTWNKTLAYKYGEALSKEAKFYNVDMLLAPGICIKRSPLCGRNFEYLSEDPYLNGFIASEYIKGLENNNVGTSLKHFVCNNQETYRSSIDEVVDERALREIYLKGFEIAVKNAQPTSIMTSYNRVNGVFSSDNKKLLTDIARNEWGFNGFFVSDWGGCAHRVDALLAGEELEMPTSGKKAPEALIEAVKDGRISEDFLNERVEKLYDSIKKIHDKKGEKFNFSFEESHKIAKMVSDEGMVLLKNDQNTLPLKKNEKILFVGDFIYIDKFEGSGSSKVNANNVVGIKKAAEEYTNIVFKKGYDLNKKEADTVLENECLEVLKDVDKVVLFIGLGELDEAESYDRKTLSLPKNQLDLLDKIYKLNQNLIVVLINGAPVTMPFIDKTKGVLEAYLGGEAFGESIVDILFGKVNPSGRLAESFPLSIKDTPCYKYFPGGTNACYYKESIYVGYRYYATFNKKVLFPFGYGLSYSKFEYRNLKLFFKNNILSIACKIKNVSNIEGKEVVQIYIGGPKSTIFKPLKELKDFVKVDLKPNEEKQIYIDIPLENLSYFNIKENKWALESGFYKIYIGGDSNNAILEKEILIKTSEVNESPYFKSTLKPYYNGRIHNITNSEFEVLLGRKLPKLNAPRFKVTENSCFRSSRHTLIGLIIYRKICSMNELKKNPFTLEYALVTPFRQLFLTGGDKISKEEQEIFLKVMNGHIGGGRFKKFIEIINKMAS